MNRRLFFSLCILLALFPSGLLFAQEAPWTEVWNSPQAEHRPLQIVHGWFAQHPDLDREAARFKSHGLGGIVSNVHSPNYLRDEDQWRKFIDSVKAARSVGLRIWIYDEDG